MADTQGGPTTPVELVESRYARYPDAVAIGRRRLGRPLTFAEKVLIAHADDPEAVCFFKNVTDLRRNAHCFRESEAAFAGERLRECFAFDKLHHDEVSPVRQISGVEDHRGVRMAQLGHRSRFAQKSIFIL